MEGILSEPSGWACLKSCCLGSVVLCRLEACEVRSVCVPSGVDDGGLKGRRTRSCDAESANFNAKAAPRPDASGVEGEDDDVAVLPFLKGTTCFAT